jgi:hypothetical protein
MAKENKSYTIDIDFLSMELTVKAKSKAEARKKAKAMIARKIKSHINHMFVDEE